MTTYVLRNGELVDAATAPPAPVIYGKVYGTGPAVISDVMPHTLHHADGRHYDSKAKYREVTRAHGCVEVGNERLKPRKPIKLDKRKRVDDIKRAMHQVRNGR